MKFRAGIHARQRKTGRLWTWSKPMRFYPFLEGGRIVEGGYWAFARRKFHDMFAATVLRDIAGHPADGIAEFLLCNTLSLHRSGTMSIR